MSHSEDFPKKEKVVLSPLQLLELTRKDSVSRHDKYKEKLRLNKNTLVKRIVQAVEAISVKGNYMLRVPDAKLGIRTMSFNKRNFTVNAVTDKGVTVNVEDQSHEYLLHLASLLSENKYTLIGLSDDDAFLDYMTHIFPDQYAAVVEQQAVHDEIVKQQETLLTAVKMTFRTSLVEMLQQLKKLGLGLRVEPITSRGNGYSSNSWNMVTLKGSSIILTNNGSNSTDAGSHMHEIRNQLHRGTATVVPCDYMF